MVTINRLPPSDPRLSHSFAIPTTSYPLLTARVPRFMVFPPSVTTSVGIFLATFDDDPMYDPSASRASMKSFCKHTATTASRGLRLMQAAAPPPRDRALSAFACPVPKPTKTSPASATWANTNISRDDAREDTFPRRIAVAGPRSEGRAHARDRM